MVDGQCMRVYEDWETWLEANVYCQSVNGQLARNINSVRNNWISDQSSKQIWFGASDTEAEGQWKDSSGVVQTYSNWRSGQPDNGFNDRHKPNQDCAFSNYKEKGYWADGECGNTLTRYYFVCEKGD